MLRFLIRHTIYLDFVYSIAIAGGAFLLFQFYSCTESPIINETEIDPTREIADQIEMIYSDSGVVQFLIRSPRMEKYSDNGTLVEEFPLGLKVEFFDKNQEVNSWLIAKYAMRRGADGTMILRDSVVLTNERNDKLETRSLEWNELDQTLTTKKFIRMIQGENRDTLYGTGFTANTDFSNFSITNFIGRRNYREITGELGLDN